MEISLENQHISIKISLTKHTLNKNYYICKNSSKLNIHFVNYNIYMKALQKEKISNSF